MHKPYINISKPGTYKVIAYYIGGNRPCDSCDPQEAISVVTDMDMPIDTVWIAICHSIFNIATTVVLFPFQKQLVDIAMFVVKDDNKEQEFVLLDERLLNTPAIALAQAAKETLRLGKMSIDALALSIDSFLDKNYDNYEVVKKEIGVIEELNQERMKNNENRWSSRWKNCYKRDRRTLIKSILEKNSSIDDKVNRLISIEDEKNNEDICDYVISYETYDDAVSQLFELLNN